MSDISYDQRAFDKERLTVDGTAGGVKLTASKYENHSALGTTKHMKALSAKIIVEGTTNVYLTEDGSDPSNTTAITLSPGQYHVVRGIEGMRNIRLKQVTTSSEVQVVYYR